ncbi:PTS sugar transporter subunit IIC [Streptococcus iniae]|uniref:Permease IIC component n=1 Tax=Streptococcus iniae TaxID=1346 RepID=A0A1J0N063_STRIN|nr:PTS sugar transporter subunit IIC [Streptococcus iniae]AGM99167.1 cellobiose permease IIC component CelB [Streptococcus iniae SF1]AHY16106.1 PTS cellobiose transporter subunit IIC [Streptococcus iniae]AHY17969.1 PTS cellobiose transporter subunit IIC [Streptococcus iniae]AJG26265.1 PTS cellobiose transporter subunit IIC [Streptococcus iniae]APD32141.1 PTS cellobiose transporter subunit IIC [Streptococcus iniae]
MSHFSDKFMEISGKMGSQRHLVAIRDSFISMMPITMAGSVAVLLNVFLRDIPTNMKWTGFATAMKPIIDINGYVYFGTIGIMALVFAFALGYHLSIMHKVNPLAGGLISFAAFVSTIPQTLTIATPLTDANASLLSGLKDLGLTVTKGNGVSNLEVSQWGAIALKYAGATGLFTALFVGFLATFVYAALTKRHIIIKMPDTVPPAVNKAFAAIIPGTAAIYVTSIVAYLIFAMSGMALNDLISKFIQVPLLGLSQGLGSVIILTFLVQLLWFFGIHGHNVLAPILDGVYLVALTENTAAYNSAHSAAHLPYLWTRGSFDAYAQMGGSGVTLAFIIAIFLFSKREEHKTVAKLSAPMGIFNINEPITFGIPIVLNPSFAIPWLITPPICATIAYLATAAGLIPPVFTPVPWITPPVLYAFLATGGNLMAALVSLFNLFVAFLIWTPFVISANKERASDS